MMPRYSLAAKLLVAISVVACSITAKAHANATVLEPMYTAQIVAPFASRLPDEPYQTDFNGNVLLNDRREVAYYTSSLSGIYRATLLDDGATKYYGWLGSINDNDSWPIAMNDLGEIAGESYADTTGGTVEHAYFWSWPTETVDIGTLYGGATDLHWCHVTAMGANGEMIGETEGADGSSHGYLWTPGATDGVAANPQMIDLGAFVPMSINSSEEIAGAYTDSSGNQLLEIYSGGEFTQMAADASASLPVSINEYGVVAGSRYVWYPSVADGLTGTYYEIPQSASQSPYGTPQNRRILLSENVLNPDYGYNAVVASDDTQTVPGEPNSIFEQHGFAWQLFYSPTANTQDIGALHANDIASTTEGASESTVQAISSAGAVTGSSVVDDAGDAHAFVYQDGDTYDLNNHIDPGTPLVAPLINTFASNRPGEILAEDAKGDIVLLRPEAPAALKTPPTVSFVWPNTLPTASPTTDMVLNGSNFSSRCEVLWKNTPVPVLSISESMIRFQVPSSEFDPPAIIPISVINSDDTQSNSVPFNLTYTQPLPKISITNPYPLVASDIGYSITFYGSALYSDTKVTLGGTVLPLASYGISGSSVTVSVPDSLAPYLVGNITASFQNPGEPAQNFTFNFQVPQPTITSSNPSSEPQYSNRAPIITGSNFFPSDTLTINGQSSGFYFVSSTQIQLSLPLSLLNTTGVYNIALSALGAASPSAFGSFTITPGSYPAPTIYSCTPTTAQIDPAIPVSLTVKGSQFYSSSVAFDGVSYAVLEFQPNALTFQVPASEFATARTVNISVTNPGPGGGTSTIPFQIIDPTTNVPQINNITPNPVTALTPTTLIVQGVNFVPASVVYMDGQSVPTTYVSFSQVTANLNIPQVPFDEISQITVVNPSAMGGTSAPFGLDVDGRYAYLSSISPASVVSRSASFTLVITGANFQPGSVVFFNKATALTTTVVSSTQLDAVVPASLLITSGDFPITVNDVDGTSDNVAFFSVYDNAPKLYDVYPSSVNSKYVEYAVILNGSQFAPDATVTSDKRIDIGSVTYLSPTQLKVGIYVGSAQPGTYQLSVAQDGLTSSSVPFQVTSVTPTVTSISPTSGDVGGRNIQLDVYGTGFNDQSVVNWNGQPLVTTLVSPTKLTAILGTYFLTGPQTAQVTVSNPLPAGGTSNAESFDVAARP